MFREFRQLRYIPEIARRRGSSRFSGAILRLVHGDHVSGRLSETLPAEQGARWAEVGVSPVRLSIVVVSYKQPMAPSYLQSSLDCQLVAILDVLDFHDGPNEETRAMAERFARKSFRLRCREPSVHHGA